MQGSSQIIITNKPTPNKPSSNEFKPISQPLRMNTGQMCSANIAEQPRIIEQQIKDAALMRQQILVDSGTSCTVVLGLATIGVVRNGC